jgi:uncharacterized membrane protein YdjX (TVP38/TMEM64 family)
MAMGKYRWIWGNLFLLLIAGVVIFYGSKLFTFINNHGVENVLNENEAVAKWIFFLICFAQPIALPIPEAVTIPAGSAVFGSFVAASIGFLGTILGVFVMFFIARISGQRLIAKFIKEKNIRKYQEYVRKNETFIIALMFIIPILPDEIICVGAGISGVSFKRFFLIASISKFITSTLLAYSVLLVKSLSLTESQLVLACSLLLSVFLFMSFIVKKTLMKEKARESASELSGR